ncbi:MAG TPA: hypothetical protein VHG91_09145 [Longimicrobium sp.]|nr:hypothetical protein [Longimicrobium sp.]
MFRPLLFALTALAACAPASGPRPGTLPVAEARRGALGATVEVSGVVTVPSGSLDRGFAVQDATGGIYVQATDSTVTYSAGQRVRVAGALAENHGLLGIGPAFVEVLGPAAAPAPRDVRTGEVGEATEGWLVRVRGTVTGDVVDDRPYGWKITIDDGSGPLLVFASASAWIDVGRVRAGQRIEAVGLSGQYDDHAEVLPRGDADLRVLP